MAGGDPDGDRTSHLVAAASQGPAFPSPTQNQGPGTWAIDRSCLFTRNQRWSDLESSHPLNHQDPRYQTSLSSTRVSRLETLRPSWRIP